MVIHHSIIFGLAVLESANASPSGIFLGVILAGAVTWLVLAMVGDGVPDRRVKAGRQYDAEGHPKLFTLTLREETATLDPGKAWIKVDTYKWVTRGLIESPQSFHVLTNGTVEINGEKINLSDTEGTLKLEHEINKSHAIPITTHSIMAASQAHKPAVAPTLPGSGKVHFKVKFDHLGHFMIECARGSEKVETGLRGLQLLVTNGLMLAPKDIHVDPLQRAVEIDGVRFEASETGAHQLEEVLNTKYAAPLQAEGEGVISIKENPAAPAGFDITFVTYHSGMRMEVKGHLSQEKLDILQDPARCDLLQPDIEFRISPPDLLIRRKRPDGGEEHIPDLPDLQYRRTTVAELQRIFNHPLIRRTKQAVGQETPIAAKKPAPLELREICVVRNPANRLLLWLECATNRAGEKEGKALTHHNIADLQHRGVFLPHLDVVLSLDNQRLSILNQENHREETINLNLDSQDEDLRKAGQMLTAALKTTNPGPL